MDMTADRLIIWTPRILGIAVALFIGLFALDAIGPGKPISDFLIHLLPSLVLLAIVAASWRWQWIGAIAFLALAAVYVAMTPSRPDWILVIAGPLVIVAFLFLWSWAHSLRST